MAVFFSRDLVKTVKHDAAPVEIIDFTGANIGGNKVLS